MKNFQLTGKQNLLKRLPVILLLVAVFSCKKESITNASKNVTLAQSEQLGVTDSIFVGAAYQGGIIFWIDGTGEHGLIAAENNIGDSAGTQWAVDPTIVTGATKRVIGAGIVNTRKIINALGNTTNAAALCVTYRHKGYADWFLPSIGELQQMMAHKDVVGGFPVNNYQLYASSNEGENHSNLALGIIYQTAGFLHLPVKTICLM